MDLSVRPSSNATPRMSRLPPASEQVTEHAPAISNRPRDPRQALLLYNDRCATCRKITAWIVRHDKARNGGEQLIDARAIGGDPEVFKQVVPNLDYYEAYKEPHVVLGNGDVKAGGEAIAEVLQRLPETRWFAWTFRLGLGKLRPFQSMLNGAYYVLDHLRPALGCESCGDTEVPWWGKPLKWTLDGFRTVKSWATGSRKKVG
jgi:predicted DCC family thiol-disulfide oxidoreductase YuxK